MGKNLYYFIYLLIFQINLLIFQSFEIQIQVPQRRDIDLVKFNPLEDFLRLNDDIEKMAHAMLNSEIDDLNKKRENSNESSKKSNRVHREVKRTAGNGFETIEITEIHIGGAPNLNQVIGMPLSGIIISKPRNLGKSGNSDGGDNFAPPIHILREFDDFFESLFGNIALGMINADFDLDDEDLDDSHTKKSNIHNEESHVNNHDGHIEITDVRDVTNDEKSNKKIKETTKDDQEKNPSENIDLELNTGQTNSKIKSTVSTDSENHEDQAVAIKFDVEAENKSSDNIMTAKERKKQILEQRKKNIFTKICKYVFYTLVLFAFYVIIKRLLQIFGLIEPENIKTSHENPNHNTHESKNVELKSTNTKSE